MALIELNDFWWKYTSSEDWVLRGIDLKVNRGELLAITGPSGAGKTSLCMCLNGLVPHTFRGAMKGSVVVEGVDTRQQSVSALSRKVGMVFQDPESQFIGMSVEEEVTFGPENLALPVDEIERRMNWALKTVGMAGAKNKAPHELSGGQKQRIAIASALVMLPKILVLDEPTSELDPIGKASVFSVVSSLRRERDLTTILVEHNTEEIARFADRVILIDRGRVEIDAPPREFFSNVDLLEKSGVEIPQVAIFCNMLRSDPLLKEELSKEALPITLEEAYKSVSRLLGGRRIHEK